LVSSQLLIYFWQELRESSKPIGKNQLPLSAAALVPVVFCNFYLVKNQKIDTISATNVARKNKPILAVLTFFEIFWHMFDEIVKQSNFTK
jgi:hypothetical protein